MRRFVLFLVLGAVLGLPTALRIIKPIEGDSKLDVDEDGLKALEEMEGPIAPVVVIGPYRSGKSFLLNQLLQLPCSKGFEVGHSRHTQTRGIWFWGDPEALPSTSGQPRVIMMDTEGFEATKKADAYDDRIFALSAILGSVLIYNLPETVKEADLEKLSFAVQLADVFYADTKFHSTSTIEERAGSMLLEPASLLWLIQRDFLTGSTVSDMVREALQEVPNPDFTREIEAVNQVRRSLRLMTGNNTAFGLKQPHMDRTKLCTLAPEEFDATYLDQMRQLRALVRAMARPKVIGGRVATGSDLAHLIRRVVQALNSRELPSAGAVIDSFNLEVMQKCVHIYESSFDFPLPVEDKVLEERHRGAQRAAMAAWQAARFRSARLQVEDPVERQLGAALRKSHADLQRRNELASATACDDLEAKCEAVFESNDRMRLPTVRKFQSGYSHCRTAFDMGCVGPARPKHVTRLDKRFNRELAQFQKDYNDRLLNGIILVSLIGVLLGRFVLRSGLLELGSWAVFGFFEIAPKVSLDRSLYDSQIWRLTTSLWENIVFNSLLDLDAYGLYLLVILAAALCTLRALSFYRRYGAGNGSPRGGGKGGNGAPTAGGAGGLLPFLFRTGSRTTKKRHEGKDLEV